MTAKIYLIDEEGVPATSNTVIVWYRKDGTSDCNLGYYEGTAWKITDGNRQYWVQTADVFAWQLVELPTVDGYSYEKEFTEWSKK